MIFEKKTSFNGNESTKHMTVSSAWLWTLLFGIFYPLIKGAWLNAMGALVAGFFTAGISWIIYPFFAGNTIQTELESQGWTRVE